MRSPSSWTMAISPMSMAFVPVVSAAGGRSRPARALFCHSASYRRPRGLPSLRSAFRLASPSERGLGSDWSSIVPTSTAVPLQTSCVPPPPPDGGGGDSEPPEPPHAPVARATAHATTARRLLDVFELFEKRLRIRQLSRIRWRHRDEFFEVRLGF